MHEKVPNAPGGWLVVGLVLGYAALLLIAPLVSIVSGAFSDGFAPVIEALTAPDALAALRLSFIIAALASVINTILGVIAAWVLVRHRFPGKTILNALVDLPFVISPVIIGFVVIVLFGRTGWIQELPFRLAFSVNGMLLVTIFVSLPFVIREVMPVLASLTPEQEEAALTLGANRWRIFWRVIFPGIRHAVIFGVVLTLARALGEFGAALSVGGGVQGVTESATIYVYRTLQDRDEISAYSMSLALGLIAVIILVTMNLVRRERKA